MSYEAYKHKSFGVDAIMRINQCNAIIEDYQSQGLRLTLRQLYYQLVSRNIIENSEKSYKGLGTLVSSARLAGRMDWDAIEDRGRQPKQASEFNNLVELAHAAVRSYRLPRWRDQHYYIELWVEKDALAGVLWPIAYQYHITLMVNKGYSSQSAMYESARRFKDNSAQNGVLLYLGDHDPSGEDMVRDIHDRLVMFEADVEVKKVALTMAQVKKYKPPPNPAKIKDPRAKKYIEKHGDSSWEVDALPPEVLSNLIKNSLAFYVDERAMDKVIAKEDEDKKRLLKAVARLK